MSFIRDLELRADERLARAGVSAAARAPFVRLVKQAALAGFRGGCAFSRAGGRWPRFWQVWRWLY